VYLNNRLVMEGDMTGPFSANIVLSNGTVDVAVLETARGGILRAGLGFDECDVGVVLNVSADHLGLRGIHTLEQLADVKGVVAAVVRREGHAVLNADDPLVYGMRDQSPGDIVLFSTAAEGENEALDEHIVKNGIAAIIENDTFVIRRGRLRIPIVPVREVPLMMGGAARFQRGNILAAIATAYVQGVRYDDIRAGLLSFFPSPSMTPGRLNLIRVRGARLLLDYAHNAAAVQGLMEMVRELPARRRIGVLAAPGDRRDDDIRALGRMGAGLDYVIVKEDADRRGRAAGETADLIIQGLHEVGLSSRQIDVVHSELDAIDRAVSLLEPDDIGVVLVDDVRGVLEKIQTLPASR
jgi:cyanophycin synthetase